LEHESHHHHHPHGTGVRWLDATLAVAAAIVSLVSLWLGLHSAHSMEKAGRCQQLPLSRTDALDFHDAVRREEEPSPDGFV
jgi:hypothetical protein